MTKNKKSVKVNVLDKYRALKTEVLPYELPFFFNNNILYELITGKITCKSITDNEILQPYVEKIFRIIQEPMRQDEKKGYKNTIPFEYTIPKKSGGVRVLSIMHPASQVGVCDFYDKYASTIATVCRRSPVSIRAPKEIASKYYRKRLATNAENFLDKIESIKSKEEYKYYTSFFSYSGYQYLFKFFSSDDCINSEQRFSKLMTFDISKCFPSIYTHTITWALRGKNFGRENIYGGYFEGDFDKLMQKANGSETNGILVGPEISRIFAEIIFQKIDLNVIADLLADKDNPLTFNKDYVLRRYVDDCFLYYHDPAVGEKIFKTYEKRLQEFRLYINEAKTIIYTAPLISNISMGKHQISKLVNMINDKLFEKSKEAEKYKIKFKINSKFLYSRLFKKIINEYKYIIKTLEIQASDIGGVIFYNILNGQLSFLSNYKLDQSENTILEIEEYLIFILDLSFYFYSHDIRVRTTEYIGYIISSICELFKNNEFATIKVTVKQRIFNGLRDIISRHDVISNGLTIDTINLLILNKLLGEEFSFDIHLVNKIIEKSDGYKNNKLNYFQIMSILFYFKGIPIELDDVVCGSIDRILKEYKPYERSESVMLLFDLLSCPYLSVSKKSLWITNDVLNKYTDLSGENLPVEELVTDWGKSFESGFTNWNIGIDFMKKLMKKEKAPSYCE